MHGPMFAVCVTWHLASKMGRGHTQMEPSRNEFDNNVLRAMLN